MRVDDLLTVLPKFDYAIGLFCQLKMSLEMHPSPRGELHFLTFWLPIIRMLVPFELKTGVFAVFDNDPHSRMLVDPGCLEVDNGEWHAAGRRNVTPKRHPDIVPLHEMHQLGGKR